MKKYFIVILTVIITQWSVLWFTGCTTDDNTINSDSIVFERICMHNIKVGSYPSGVLSGFYRDLWTDNIYRMTSIDGGIAPYYNENSEIMKYGEFEKFT